MHFTALGGADEIGASCYLLEIAGYRWLGEMQGSRRHRGQVRYDEQRVIVELERTVLGEPAWGKRYAGWDEVAARFLGEQLVIEPGRAREVVEATRVMKRWGRMCAVAL